MGKIKLKTKKSAAKRFSYTGTGKLKRNRAAKGHLLTGKSSKRKRMLRRSEPVSHAELAIIKKMLPYD